MMCSIFESAAYNFRETDDLLNPVGAACATGVIYKITAVRRSQAPQRRVAAWSPPQARSGGWRASRAAQLLAHSQDGTCLCLRRGRGLRSPLGWVWARWPRLGRL